MCEYALGWRQAALSSADVLDWESCRTHLSPLFYTSSLGQLLAGSYNSRPEASDGPHASLEFE